MTGNLELGESTAGHLQAHTMEKPEKENTAPVQPLTTTYPSGWRLHAISFGLCFSLFMSQMESSVASTAILVISDHLGGFDESSWVFTAYLLTYSGFPIIASKLSDIFGRKPLMLLSLTVFIIFSGACGAAQSLTQLIMFRWVQGIGGSGIYAIATLYFFELVPPEKWSIYASLVTSSIALSVIVAPLIGGAITVTGQWRWIFLVNVPMGCVALALLAFVMPARLEVEPAASYELANNGRGRSRRSLRKVDLLGATLLLGTCLLLATALQKAAEGHMFSSSVVLPLLIIGPLLGIAFMVWEWHTTTRRTVPEPILPWRFFQSRNTLGMMLNAFFSGTILTALIVQIPQRFMTVNGLSPLAAGSRLLPFAAWVPGGSTLAAIAMGRMKLPPIYILLAGSIFETAGIVGLSKSSTQPAISASQYGFQILAGAGVGCFNVALALLVPYVTEKRDLAVGTGIVAQFRMLGGLIALSIVTCVFTPVIRHKLSDILSTLQVETLLDRTEVLGLLPEAKQEIVRRIFGQGYNLQMRILIGFAVAQFPAVALMWRRKAIILES